LTASAPAPAHVPITFLGLTLEQFRGFCVWLMLASSFFVIKEPAPCDVLFILNFVLFIATGLRIPLLVMPLFLFLLLYNLGGFTSLLSVPDDQKNSMYVLTTAYMSASAIFFAAYVAEDPPARMTTFRNAYILGAVFASVIGIMSYFNVAGLGVLAPEQRATGTFKDPNVLSTFLIFPALALVQGFMLNQRGHTIKRLAALLIIMACLFLAFSRGAWISFMAATLLMIAFTFALTPAANLRVRIILLSVVGVVIAAILLVGLLSIDPVRQLFFDRLTLVKQYDSGETGRFGNQLNSIKFLLVQPFGFGPLLFSDHFGQDPHNAYINAFSSYGWLGGIVYFILLIASVTVGLRAVLTRTPWQNWSIVVFFPMLTTFLQGIQIDTDHWRHFYWLIGTMWGLAAASYGYRQDLPAVTQTLAGSRGRTMVGAVGFEPTTPTPPE
jgi:hypothetical protein